MGLSRLENTVLKQFRKDLEQALEGKLVELKLFGSKARGNDRDDSDVDVLVVVSTDDWRISEVIYKIATEVLLDTEVCISPKVVSAKQYDCLREEGSSFIRSIIRDGVTV